MSGCIKTFEGEKMTIYKLTDENMRTHGGFQWELNVPAPELPGGRHCTDEVYHWYADPLLAVLLNPVHAGFINPRLFKGVGIQTGTDGLKCWGITCTLEEEMPLPEISTTQKVAFVILCALEVYKEPSFAAWAKDWLSNKDRDTAHAICMTRVTDAIYADAYADIHAAAYSDIDVDAAYATVYAITSARDAAHAATYIDVSDTDAIYIVASSAAYAANTSLGKTLDFAAIARKAMEVK